MQKQKSDQNAFDDGTTYNPFDSLDVAGHEMAHGGSIYVHYSSGPANHFFYLLAEGSAPLGLPPARPVTAAR